VHQTPKKWQQARNIYENPPRANTRCKITVAPQLGGGIIGSDAGQAVEAASEAESAGRGSTEETEAETNPTVLFLFSHGFADRVQFRPSLGIFLGRS
jgi:hypothetical protein